MTTKELELMGRIISALESVHWTGECNPSVTIAPVVEARNLWKEVCFENAKEMHRKKEGQKCPECFY